MSVDRHEYAARCAHAAARAFLLAQGQDRAGKVSPPWEDLPEDRREGLINAARIVEAGATPEDLWVVWSAHKLADGWRPGRKFDAKARTLPELGPEWEDLPFHYKAAHVMFHACLCAVLGVR